MKRELLDLTIDEMKEFAAELGERPYRGKQLFQWIHRDLDLEDDDLFAGATALPKEFRSRLDEETVVTNVSVEEMQVDPGDETRKFLFGLGAPEDRVFVEGVFMKYGYGKTMCISSQAGCRMGCSFCASGLDGLIRDLTAGEMIGQIVAAERYAQEKVDHIVIMGTGEPFDNYRNLSRFLRIIHEPEGRKMSWRNITVSTCGIIPGIVAFAEDFPQVNLAISLHRATDEERSRLMPVNRKYPLEELMAVTRDYTEKTRRRVTFEYALIEGENDRDEDALRLAGLLKGMLCHVNLIPLNKVDEVGKRGSSRKRAGEFRDILEKAGVPATLRRKLGDSIDGACGQLRLHRDRKK